MPAVTDHMAPHAAEAPTAGRAAMRLLWPLLPAGLAFAFYCLCLAPGLTFGDGAGIGTRVHAGDATASATSHAPYIWIAQVWLRLVPDDSVAWRLNLMSAFWAAVALAVLTTVSRRMLERLHHHRTPVAAGCVLAAGLLIANHSFWWSAVRTEVYSLSAALAAGLLWCALRFETTRRERYAVTLIGGLTLGAIQHLQVAALIAWWGPYVLWRLHRRGTLQPAVLAKLAVAAILGAAPFFYLFWRDVTVSYGSFRLATFFMFGGPYIGLVQYADTSALWNLRNVLTIVLWDLTPWGLALACAGAWRLWRSDRPMFGWLLPAAVLSAGPAAWYVVPDQPDFFIMCYVFCTPLVAIGAAEVAAALRRRGMTRLVPAGVGVAIVVPLVGNLMLPAPQSREDWDRLQRRRPYTMHTIMTPRMRGQSWLDDWARAVLHDVAPGARILAYHMTDSSAYTALFHHQTVYGLREDVELSPLFGNISLDSLDVREIFEADAAERPLYITNWNPRAYGTIAYQDDFTFTTEGKVIRVRPAEGGAHWQRGPSLPCEGAWAGLSGPDGRPVRLDVRNWTDRLRVWIHVPLRIRAPGERAGEWFIEQPAAAARWDDERKTLSLRWTDFQGFPLALELRLRGDSLAGSWRFGEPPMLTGEVELRRAPDRAA